MKIITRFLPAFVCLCMLIACSKSDDGLGIATKQLKSGTIFTVSPSGNYNDDTYNIQTALNNAIAAGQGSTVKLTAGTFYLKDIIEVDGFDGFFTGAGKDKTFITTHDPIPFDASSGDMFALLKFRHGNLHMSDLTFNISLTEPCAGPDDLGGHAMYALVMVTGSSLAAPSPAEQPASASFSNINFIGGEGLFQGMFNVVHFLWLGAEETFPRPYELVDGSFTVQNCNFNRAAVCVTNNADKNCTWKIGGSGATGNVFETSICSVQQGESAGSTYEISYNSFKDMRWGAILASQGMYYDPSILAMSKFSIHHNQITMTDYGDGIMLIDDSFYGDGRKLADAVVSNNQVELRGGMGGIYGEGIQGAIITGNKISGAGYIGIYFPCWYRGDGEICRNIVLQGNNVQSLAAESGVGIVLGRSTIDCSVIGGAASTTVFNRGTNNILTGVTNMQGNDPGDAISLAMQAKHDMIKSLR